MRKRKFFRLHSYGITAVLILTALMILATPNNGFGGEWLILIAYIVYLICDWHSRDRSARA
mgnify:CR=1 FL=1